MKFKKYKNEVNKRYPGKMKTETLRMLYKRGVSLQALLVEMRNEAQKQELIKENKSKLERIKELTDETSK